MMDGINIFQEQNEHKKLKNEENSYEMENIINKDSEIDLDDFVIVEDTDPKYELIAFINPKSGGGQGVDLIEKFSKILTTMRVFDLMEQNGPEKGIENFKNHQNVRIIAAGGDGTGRWVLETLDKFNFDKEAPPVGILPLGTGNDIGRAFGWGGGYSGESVEGLIKSFKDAKIANLDRWKVDILPFDISLENSPQSSYLNNYLSIGFTDAKIALDFHKMREENPHLCKTRAINKMWYLSYGMKAFSEKIISSDTPNLSDILSISVDKKEVELKDIEGVIVLNLQTYAGGTDMWGPADPFDGNKYKHVSFNDGLLEVIGVRSVVHLGSIMTGVGKGVRLGQGSEILIEYRSEKCSLPGKIDGEPWLQKFPCTIQIRHFKQSPMLINKEWENAMASMGEYKMAGYLDKTSFRLKFRRRFYVLTHYGKLFYYVNQQSGGPKGEIKLPKSTKQVIKGSVPTLFKLFDPVKRITYEIYCPTEPLRDEWVEKLKEVINSIVVVV